jgi:3-dehydroquinate dehydratase-1
MTTQGPVKTRARERCDIVGVIASEADLRMAGALDEPPDFFELRLDHLFPIRDDVEKEISQLKAPVIVTARHPSEGGANNLSGARRRDLLMRFLPYAKYVDVELRSADSLHSLLPQSDVARILSLHDFDSTPTPRSLHAKARKAKSLGAAIFKVATRTDTPAQLARLLEFISEDEVGLPVSAMGIGSLGALSRILLAGCGSCLAYASLADANVEGQLAVPELRSAFRLLGLRQ